MNDTALAASALVPALLASSCCGLAAALPGWIKGAVFVCSAIM